VIAAPVEAKPLPDPAALPENPGPPARQPVADKAPTEHAERPAPRAAELPKSILVRQAKDAFSAGDLDRALRLATDALAQGADADAWIVVGNVDFKRRRYDAAGMAYQEALRLQPDNEKILKRRQMAQKLAAGTEPSP
jgi:tetratricopeptide (TPR) repeat protein